MSVLREILNNEDNMSRLNIQSNVNPLMDNYLSDDSEEEILPIIKQNSRQLEADVLEQDDFRQDEDAEQLYHEEEKENTFTQSSYSGVSQQHSANIQ